MMEVGGGKVLWFRNKSLGLQYTTMLSDGDSKLYNELMALKPYGRDVAIYKEECINHVGKRLGSALRKLVSDQSKQKITLGGRGHGRLTQSAIQSLQSYYTRAVHSFPTAEKMRDAIIGGLNHCFSTDENRTDSWCFYNQALSNNKSPHPIKPCFLFILMKIC